MTINYPTWFSLPTDTQKRVITAFYPCRCSISWIVGPPFPELPLPPHRGADPQTSQNAEITKELINKQANFSNTGQNAEITKELINKRANFSNTGQNAEITRFPVFAIREAFQKSEFTRELNTDVFDFADTYLGGRANWLEEYACALHGGPERRTAEQESGGLNG